MRAKITRCETGDAAFAVDRNGVIVLWNQAAEQVMGYSSTTAIGQFCWKLLCGEDVYGNQYCCKRCPLREMAFRRKSVNTYQATFKTAYNGRTQFSISCMVVFDDAGTKLLLHICRPEKETAEYHKRHGAISSLVSKHLDNLTKRENEVLTLLADGHSTRDIASSMGISTSTVRNHIQHLMRKLNAHNRLEAVMTGQRLKMN